jgi:hypothetical protein
MTNLQVVDSLSSFYSPHSSAVLSSVTALAWRIGFEPEYIESDEEPPLAVPDDSETFPIDDYLGRYLPQERRIVIYTRAVLATAARMSCNPAHIRQVVVAHEYAHAILHLGFDDNGNQCDTAAYMSIDDRIHESIAQLLTARVIEARIAGTNDEQANAAWRQLGSVVFPDLERRQSALYTQWHKFESLPPECLRSLLLAVRRAAPMSGWEAFSLMGD